MQLCLYSWETPGTFPWICYFSRHSLFGIILLHKLSSTWFFLPIAVQCSWDPEGAVAELVKLQCDSNGFGDFLCVSLSLKNVRHVLCIAYWCIYIYILALTPSLKTNQKVNNAVMTLLCCKPPCQACSLSFFRRISADTGSWSVQNSKSS